MSTDDHFDVICTSPWPFKAIVTLTGRQPDAVALSFETSSVEVVREVRESWVAVSQMALEHWQNRLAVVARRKIILGELTAMKARSKDIMEGRVVCSRAEGDAFRAAIYLKGTQFAELQTELDRVTEENAEAARRFADFLKKYFDTEFVPKFAKIDY